jgi:uncharacterized membrane protein
VGGEVSDKTWLERRDVWNPYDPVASVTLIVVPLLCAVFLTVIALVIPLFWVFALVFWYMFALSLKPKADEHGRRKREG